MKRSRRLPVLVGFFVIFLIIPLLFILWAAKDLSSNGKSLITAYKGGNFENLKKETAATRGSLQKIDFSLNFLFWMRIIPFAGGYYLDAKGFSSAGSEELIALEKIITNLESSADRRTG